MAWKRPAPDLAGRMAADALRACEHLLRRAPGERQQQIRSAGTPCWMRYATR